MIVVLHQGHDGLQGQGPGKARFDVKGLVQVRAGRIDVADGQGIGRALGQKDGVVLICDHLARFRRIGDGREVERPLDRVARFDNGGQHRGLALFGDGRLAAGQGRLAGLVGRQHPALEDRQEGLVLLDADEKFGAAHAGHHEGRIHLQFVGLAGEEMGRPF